MNVLSTSAADNVYVNSFMQKIPSLTVRMTMAQV